VNKPFICIREASITLGGQYAIIESRAEYCFIDGKAVQVFGGYFATIYRSSEMDRFAKVLRRSNFEHCKRATIEDMKRYSR